MKTTLVAEGTPVPNDDEDKIEDAAQDQSPKDGKDGKAPKDEKIGKAGDDAPDHAEGQAVGNAEAGEEDHPAAKVSVKRNFRLDSRKKILMTQRNLMKKYSELSPTLSELQSQRMEFSPGSKQISSTHVNQLIEKEFEKRIKLRLPKYEIQAEVKRRLFQDGDQQDEEERFNALYQERL